MPMRARLLMAGSLLLAIGCAQKDAAPAHDSATPAPMATAAGVTRAPYGTMPDGKTVEQFTLRNAHGIEVRAITYGAIITVLKTPDKAGQLGDIVYGNDSLPGYLGGTAYFGAIFGVIACPVDNTASTVVDSARDTAKQRAAELQKERRQRERRDLDEQR